MSLFNDAKKLLQMVGAVSSQAQVYADVARHEVHRVQDAAPKLRAQVTGEWVMPRYQGTDICDHLPTIARLKREGDYEAALELAIGCMNAMHGVALTQPENAMEHYVVEVLIIQHKLKLYREELCVIDWWRGTGITAADSWWGVELAKRYAKACELCAREDGIDPSPYTAQWRALVAHQKEMKERGVGTPEVQSGRTKAHPEQARARSASDGRSGSRCVSPPRKASQRRGSYVPSADQLMAREFVAVDFETANRQGGVSACQIALVKVRDGRIVDRFVSYLLPPRGFQHFEFTYLHGISLRDVKRAPSWDTIRDTVGSFIGALPVYAHNAAFDSRVWKELDEYYGISTYPRAFFCSYRLAARVMPGLENHKLPTVTQACVPGYRLNHHRADSDAEACALIVASLQRSEIAAQLP